MNIVDIFLQELGLEGAPAKELKESILGFALGIALDKLHPTLSPQEIQRIETLFRSDDMAAALTEFFQNETYKTVYQEALTEQFDLILDDPGLVSPEQRDRILTVMGEFLTSHEVLS